MSGLQKAIEEITYVSKKFPQKAFNVVTANREEALPYLRSALEKAIEERDELEENYQLCAQRRAINQTGENPV